MFYIHLSSGPLGILIWYGLWSLGTNCTNLGQLTFAFSYSCISIATSYSLEYQPVRWEKDGVQRYRKTRYLSAIRRAMWCESRLVGGAEDEASERVPANAPPSTPDGGHSAGNNGPNRSGLDSVPVTAAVITRKILFGPRALIYPPTCIPTAHLPRLGAPARCLPSDPARKMKAQRMRREQSPCFGSRTWTDAIIFQSKSD